MGEIGKARRRERYSVRHNVEGFGEIKWARSATKHRISKIRSLFVVERAGCCFEQEPPGLDARLWFFGDDPEGIALEVLGVEAGRHSLVLIHAMKLRARHRDAYEEAGKWQEGSATR